jgi:GTP-binding protein
VQALIPEITPYFEKLGLKVFPVSAATGEGIPVLLDELARKIWAD